MAAVTAPIGLVVMGGGPSDAMTATLDAAARVGATVSVVLPTAPLAEVSAVRALTRERGVELHELDGRVPSVVIDAALRSLDATWVGVVRTGDELDRRTTDLLGRAVGDATQVVAVTTDLLVDHGSTTALLADPDWSPARLADGRPAAGLVLLRRDVLPGPEVGARSTAPDVAALARIGGDGKVRHLRLPLLRRRGGSGPAYPVAVARCAVERAQGPVSSRPAAAVLLLGTGSSGARPVLDHLGQLDDVSVVVAVPDGATTDDLARHPAVTAVVHVPAGPTGAALAVAAAEVEPGLDLLLVTDDVVPERDRWWPALHDRLAVDGVGAVGAVVLRPDGRIADHGVVAVGGAPVADLHGLDPSSAPGEAGVSGERLGVSGACVLVRREVWEAIDDADLRRSDWWHVELGLRTWQAGWRVVVAGDAVVRRCHERGSDRDPRALGRLRDRWAGALDDDPFHLPGLEPPPRTPHRANPILLPSGHDHVAVRMSAGRPWWGDGRPRSGRW